jgi:hypothetical protein
MVAHLRPLALLVALVAIALAAAPPAARADRGLARVPVHIGGDVLFDEARNDGRQGGPGTWSVTEGRLTRDSLRLHVEIDPVLQGLPVQSGPAVLFAGMQAVGGSGDRGLGMPIDALATVELPPCDDADCRYSADVELPTAGIPGAIDRLDEMGDFLWIEVALTLVRTYGDGSWLQVTPLAPWMDGASFSDAGRLGNVKSVGGRLFRYGLFPADLATPIPRRGGWMFTSGFDYGRVVERLRKRVGDPSSPIPGVDARLHVTIEPTCLHAAHLTLHDDAGDRVFDTDVYDTAEVDAAVRLPAGTTWRLTLHDGGGIDFDQGRQGWGVRVGSIEAAAGPLDIAATFECVTPSGEVEVVGATQASAAPTSAPPRPAPTIEPSSALTSADGDRRAWLGAVVAAGIAASVVLVVVLGRRRSR